MKTHSISNFTKAEAVEIAVVEASYGSLVTLFQRAGSSWFQFSMTPEQAREMAAVLITLADQQKV